MDAGGLDTLDGILNRISESLNKLKTSNSDLDASTADIEKILDDMKEKLAKGIYAQDTNKQTSGKHPRIVAATTSGYTL